MIDETKKILDPDIRVSATCVRIPVFISHAESINLEIISFHLTYNIISSIEPSMDRANIGSQLATAFIYNNDYQKALKWIIFTQNSNFSNENLEKVKLLYDLYRSKDTQKILEYINENYENLIDNESTNTKEILLVTSKVLDSDKSYNSSLFFEKVMDERQMPTIFLNSEIEQAINKNTVAIMAPNLIGNIANWK